MKIIRQVSTRMTEDHDPVVTELTLDFSDLTNEDILEIAAQSATIKWQGNARRGKEIPTTATYKVSKPGTRVQIDPAEALIRKYGSVDEAVKALQAMMKK